MNHRPSFLLITLGTLTMLPVIAVAADQKVDPSKIHGRIQLVDSLLFPATRGEYVAGCGIGTSRSEFRSARERDDEDAAKVEQEDDVRERDEDHFLDEACLSVPMVRSISSLRS